MLDKNILIYFIHKYYGLSVEKSKHLYDYYERNGMLDTLEKDISFLRNESRKHRENKIEKIRNSKRYKEIRNKYLPKEDLTDLPNLTDLPKEEEKDNGK